MPIDKILQHDIQLVQQAQTPILNKLHEFNQQTQIPQLQNIEAPSGIGALMAHGGGTAFADALLHPGPFDTGLSLTAKGLVAANKAADAGTKEEAARQYKNALLRYSDARKQQATELGIMKGAVPNLSDLLRLEGATIGANAKLAAAALKAKGAAADLYYKHILSLHKPRYDQNGNVINGQEFTQTGIEIARMRRAPTAEIAARGAGGKQRVMKVPTLLAQYIHHNNNDVRAALQAYVMDIRNAHQQGEKVVLGKDSIEAMRKALRAAGYSEEDTNNELNRLVELYKTGQASGGFLSDLVHNLGQLFVP